MPAQPLKTIGGSLCQDKVLSTLLDHEDTQLTQFQLDKLWQLFVRIGEVWGNQQDSSEAIRSSWLEFIRAKTTSQPIYTGEYANAVMVIQELEEMYQENAFEKLFLNHGIPEGPPVTRIAHCKTYVVNEFIRVQIVAGGFKGFNAPSSLNYKGYVGGSRYNLTPRVRSYPDTKGE